MDQESRKRGIWLTIILIVMLLDALSGGIHYAMVILEIQEPVLSIPMWANKVFLVWAVLVCVFTICIWFWRKWAVYAEIISTIAGFIFGFILEIPIYAILIGPIILLILLLSLRPKWSLLK